MTDIDRNGPEAPAEAALKEDGLCDFEALFRSELAFGEGGAGRGLHLLPLGFGLGAWTGSGQGCSAPAAGGGGSRPIEDK